MALAVEVSKQSFSSGEVSPAMRVRSDLGKNQSGLWFCENMVVLLEGGVTRRPGTQMVLQLNANNAYVAIPFRFSGSGSNAYLIVIGAGVAQFILGNSVVVIGGGNNNPFTVPVPYTEADLGGVGATVPGVSNLRYAIEGNAVFLFCDGHAPQVLLRLADNSWTLSPYIIAPAVPVPQGGCIAPIDTENLDAAEQIAVNLLTGANAQTPGATVTLTASPAFALAGATVPNGFQAGHIGSVWRLDESDLSLTPEWTADEVITVPTTDFTASNNGTVGTGWTNIANAFDGNTATDATQNGVLQGYIGLSFATAQSVYEVTIQGDALNDVAGNGIAITAKLYGKNGAPANATDGVFLGQTSWVGHGGRLHSIFANNPTLTFDHIWVVFSTVAAENYAVAELRLIQFNNSSGIYRRFNGNVYQALASGNAGANPPVHPSGVVLSGNGGVQWLYIHRDRGFVLINAITSSTVATATVLEALPLSVLAEPTGNWWPSAWDGIKGWPDRAAITRGSLIVGRQDKFWITQPNTLFNYDIVDPTSAQSAIAGRLISPTGELAWIESFMGGLYLGALTRDGEWVLVGQDILSAISVQNLSPYMSKQQGSSQHIPAAAEGGLITIDRTRTRAFLVMLAYSYFMPQYAIEELTLSARHILGEQGGGALGVTNQKDPNRINWFWCKNGLLVGNTLMVDQKINGWHRHPQHAATSSEVLYAATIPSSDESIAWTYFITQRTINGTVKKFVELLQPFFVPVNANDPDATGAWFLDCALRYQGAPVNKLLGLNHLAGQAVGVHADGCMVLNADGTLPVVAADGSLTLPLNRLTQDAIVGLPISYRARLLPLDLQLPQGSSAGRRQKANHLIYRVVNSAGGNLAINPDEGGIPENLELDADEGATMVFGTPIPLKNGPYRTAGLDVPLADQCIVEFTGYQTPAEIECDTMPFTLIGVDPDIDIAEQD